MPAQQNSTMTGTTPSRPAEICRCTPGNSQAAVQPHSKPICSIINSVSAMKRASPRDRSAAWCRAPFSPRCLECETRALLRSKAQPTPSFAQARRQIDRSIPPLTKGFHRSSSLARHVLVAVTIYCFGPLRQMTFRNAIAEHHDAA